MADYVVSDTSLTAVADAIRTKGGTSASLAFPAGFVQAIADIPTGGGGDYTAEDFLLSAKPVGAISSDAITSVPAYRMRGRTGITSVSLPNCTSVSDQAFYNCTNLASIHFPSISVLNASTFLGCALQYAVFPSVTGVKNYSLQDNAELLAADFGGQISTTQNTGFYGAGAFSGCTKMSILVIRNAGSAQWKLTNINNLANTPFASGKSGGTLYVPQAKIADYQAATNWSTILGYPNNRILPIEGSPYETHYVDGTPIPTA